MSPALAGLRRLAEHARAELNEMTPVDFDSVGRDDRARHWYASLLAVQVLQLVVDCLPDDDQQAAPDETAAGWRAAYEEATSRADSNGCEAIVFEQRAEAGEPC